MIWNKLRTVKELFTLFCLRGQSFITTYESQSKSAWADDSYKIMTYTPQHIANYFLTRSFKENVPLSPLKLLKLVYIAYGWNLALKDERLFHEPIEAWEHGPVVPTLYHEFKHYRREPITELAEDYDGTMGGEFIPMVPENAGETRLILDKVWAAYNRFTAWALRNKTHEEGGPWANVYDPRNRDIVLDDDDIKQHYKLKIRAYLDAAKNNG